MVTYRDGKGNMPVDLLHDGAMKRAEAFVVLYNGKVDERSSISSAQLRRFYGEFKSLEKRFHFKRQNDSSENPFLSILPLIKMVKSKAAYAANPKNRKIPESFQKWMEECIDAINTQDDFEAFLLHFEAVVGFCYGRGLSNK